MSHDIIARSFPKASQLPWPRQKHEHKRTQSIVMWLEEDWHSHPEITGFCFGEDGRSLSVRDTMRYSYHQMSREIKSMANWLLLNRIVRIWFEHESMNRIRLQNLLKFVRFFSFLQDKHELLDALAAVCSDIEALRSGWRFAKHFEVQWLPCYHQSVNTSLS